MKETPIFEELCIRLVRQPQVGLKLLIGGLLSFVPVLNLLAFGYLYRLTLKVRQTGRFELPNWEDWSGLFRDGIRFAIPWLAYWLVPVGGGFVLASILGSIGLGALSYLLFSVILALSPVFLGAALFRVQARNDFKALLDVVLILRLSVLQWSRMLVPILTFAGLLFVAGPLYGFSMFIGFVLILTYTTYTFSALESRR